LLADAADGRLDQYSLVEAALVVAGTSDRVELRRLGKKFDALADEAVRSLDSKSPAQERAAAIRQFLHERVLDQYRSDASNVAETLRNGSFNCVSASVLFVALAQRCGLNAHAVQLPEHVRCEVIADGLAMPIETTALIAGGGQPLGLPSRRRPARTLTPVELIATIYYNRGVAAFDSGNLQAAIDLNTIAVELDPDCRQARDNLLAAINNRVVELVKGNESGQALQLLDHGLEIAPRYQPFLTNRDYLTRNDQMTKRQ
jgi:tetratricopeptide (TPR) repeat protein